MQILQIGVERSEMPNNYKVPYDCVPKSVGVYTYRSHLGNKDQELEHLLPNLSDFFRLQEREFNNWELCYYKHVFCCKTIF